jgi:adenine-specific DNA-methyltransferase
LLTANAPIAKTLRPCREESVGFDITKNLFIEGDNLDALKLLQETYLGKIKMIYIDPPYNTGGDFIYADNFVVDPESYKLRSGEKNEAAQRLVANTEANGRFHSDWLSMMLPRLKLARNLLRDDGVIFISIHDVELASLKKVCEEIFGTENFVGQITWKARVKPVNIGEAKYRPQKEVEYVLMYQKSYVPGTFFPLYTGGERTYPHELNGRKYRLTTILKSNRGANHRSTMSFPLGDYSPPEGQRWQAGEDVINQLNNDGYIEFRDGTPFRRYFEDEEGAEHDPFYCFMEVDWSSTSEAGKNQLNEILGNQHGFDTVKPVRLLKTLIQACTSQNESHLVMDFFGGSGTTAHAVMQLNSEDGGNREFILVQVPEPPITKSGVAKYENIAELCKDRIRRSGSTILAGDVYEEWNRDIGFRVLKIDTSNMADVYYAPDSLDKAKFDLFVDNIKPGRTPEDMLFQVMLDWGVDLALPITKQSIQGKDVFFVDGNALAACFDASGSIDEAFVKELANQQLLRVVFRDAGYKDSAVKINVEQIFKLLSPATEVKCI